MNKRHIIAAFALLGTLFLAGCGAKEDLHEASAELYAMDTVMQIDAYGARSEEACEAARKEILRIDALLSTGKDTSEVSELNRAGGGDLSADTSYLMKRSIEFHAETDGAFDITIYPVMKAWGFDGEEQHVPAEAELAKALALVNADALSYNDTKKTVKYEMPGMEVDFGGIAKGYTSSRLMELFKSYGISHAKVNLGGNVQTIGTSPDGDEWHLAVKNPKNPSDYVGILYVNDKAVVTSGGYERKFTENGKTYHHIIDPETGYPAESGLTSVTIVSGDGTLADALSTSVFIMGLEKGTLFWQQHADEFDMVLVDENGGIHVTEGIADSLKKAGKVNVIKKP